MTTMGWLRESCLVITWRSEDGAKYRVQSKDNLADPDWTDLSEEVVATGATASWTDSAVGAAAHRFYRVRQVE